MTAAILTVMIFVALLSFYALHKIRQMHLLTFKLLSEINKIEKHTSQIDATRTEITNIYRQYQSYQNLLALIKPTAPMPPLRGWAASPDFLVEICRYTLKSHPEVIIECSSGATTLALARCCELIENGHVISLEHDPFYAAQTRERLIEHGLTRWATVVHAPLSPRAELKGHPWYSIHGMEITPASCQLVVIDGPPSDTAPCARYPALPLLAHLLAPDCTVFLDDAARPDEQAAIQRWLREFPDFHLNWIDCEKGCAQLTRGIATGNSRPIGANPASQDECVNPLKDVV